MMNEIEKMYKLANVQPYYKKRIECKEGYSIGQPCGKSPCIDCDKSVFEDVMPPFTAEKQIELIKWLSSKYGIYIVNVDKYSIGFGTCAGEFCTKENFEDVLAESINHLWQDLTEEEKQQVKGILE